MAWTVLWVMGCVNSESLTEQTYACQTDLDCLGGYVCVPSAEGLPYGHCGMATEQPRDAVMADVADTTMQDTSKPLEVEDGSAALCTTHSCFVDDDCLPKATGGQCRDDTPEDCDTTRCLGAKGSQRIVAGIPATEDWSTWQSGDDESTGKGPNRWYCNAAQPVSDAGVLTRWEMWVDNGGAAGEPAQLLVIRCSDGGAGDSGPVMAGCTRVALGPLQKIDGDGPFSATLAGSTQQDDAAPNDTGMVVEPGDILCALSKEFDIGGDCNASSTSGGCPGPTFDMQFEFDLDTASEPFALQDSEHEAMLMVRASGSSPRVAGTCYENTPKDDGATCSEGDGESCCRGACVSALNSSCP